MSVSRLEELRGPGLLPRLRSQKVRTGAGSCSSASHPHFPRLPALIQSRMPRAEGFGHTEGPESPLAPECRRLPPADLPTRLRLAPVPGRKEKLAFEESPRAGSLPSRRLGCCQVPRTATPPSAAQPLHTNEFAPPAPRLPGPNRRTRQPIACRDQQVNSQSSYEVDSVTPNGSLRNKKSPKVLGGTGRRSSLMRNTGTDHAGLLEGKTCTIFGNG